MKIKKISKKLDKNEFGSKKAKKLKTLKERAENYNKMFPNYPSIIVDKDWLYGMWVIGNNYHSKKNYYGEYPPSYLKRVYSLFPDAKNVLHLFSGVVESGLWLNECRFDIKPELKPDVIGDAHKLSNYFSKELFDLILADPPYSNEDAMHYGTPMINRNKVVKECYYVLKAGGFLCWLDQVLPMYRKIEFRLVGIIGIVRSTNHRFRVLSIFQKIGDDE